MSKDHNLKINARCGPVGKVSGGVWGGGEWGAGVRSLDSPLRSSVALVSSESDGEKKHRADPTERNTQLPLKWMSFSLTRLTIAH